MNKNNDWSDVKYRMKAEGFDYCWRDYSSFSEIDDEKFHQLRKAYREIATTLENYVNEKAAESVKNNE